MYKRCIDLYLFIPVKKKKIDSDIEGKTLIFIVDSQFFTCTLIITALSFFFFFFDTILLLFHIVVF